MSRALQVIPEDQLRHIARNHQAFLKISTDHNNDSLLEGVLSTAGSHKITAVHRVAAWNALSAIVDHGDLHSQLWQRSFEVFLEHSHNARPKSSKQLLNSLGAALRRTAATSDLRSICAKRLVECIQPNANAQVAKSALQTLAHFLGKGSLSIRDVLPFLRPTDAQSPESYRNDVQNLIMSLLQWVGKGDFGSAVAHALSIVLETVESDSSVSRSACNGQSPDSPLWMQPLEEVLKLRLIEIDELRAHIFPTLFKRNLEEYILFIYRHGLNRMRSCSQHILDPTIAPVPDNKDLLYAALQAGKDLGLLLESESLEISRTPTCVLVPIRYIQPLLSEQSRRARLTGLSLLIASHSITKPFSRATLNALRRHLHVFFADTDANFRSELFSLMQKMMDRFRAITAVLERKRKETPSSNGILYHEDHAILDAHQSFLQWLLSFLQSELRPTASYQRHISALKTLVIVSRSGLDSTVPADSLSKAASSETKWPFHMPILTHGSRRMLIDLILDPFDDVRQTAALILELCDVSPQAAIAAELCSAIVRAEDATLLTGRADQADGVGRLYALLYRHCRISSNTTSQLAQPRILKDLLDKADLMLGFAKRDLAIAVAKYPMHGLLSSFRYILTQQSHDPELQRIVPTLSRYLQEVWDIVHPVLCDDAPEGYLPEQSEEAFDVSTKDTLSYCWRALKESSLLLGTMASNLPLDEHALRDLGDLCFRQLAELRHRGAFSTVAQIWITCCNLCRSQKTKSGKALIQYWYEETINLLSSRMTINTRRSAGIPALLCGLLIADKSGRLFPLAFQDLTSISKRPVEQLASEVGSLPQVHALNCIKDILKNTRLGEQSAQYVPPALRLAAESIQSDTWAVRNCGLMLFRAVIDRLFGTSDSYLESSTTTHSNLTIHQHPELLETILGLLDSPRIVTSEGVFPALQFLQHMEVPHGLRSRAITAVFALTASSSWHIRDKAAQTYARMFAPHEIDAKIQRLLESVLEAEQKQNALHGALLCIKYLIRRLLERQTSTRATLAHSSKTSLEVPSGLSPSWHVAIHEASIVYHDNRCTFTKAAYVDVVAEARRYREHLTAQNPALVGSAKQVHLFDVKTELDYALQEDAVRPDEHILRRALARAYAHELRSNADDMSTDHERNSGFPFPILQLARKDSGACCIFLTTSSQLRLPDDVMRRIGHSCRQILMLNADITLKCEAQRWLLKAADRSLWNRPDVGALDPYPLEFCEDLSSPCSTNSNQEYADLCLQLQDVALKLCLLSKAGVKPDKSALAPLHLWMKQCCEAIGGHGLFTREAAALAVGRLNNAWQHVASMQQDTFCDLCFGIYDLLIDDDEDIRLLASNSAAYIFSLPAMPNENDVLEPSCATGRLAKWMLNRWSHNSHFTIQVVLRAFGISPSVSVSVADQVAKLETVDSALFAEERQNLYIDHAREVKFWSRVLLRMEIKLLPKSLVRALCEWVSDGLAVLTAKTAKEKDGALGWTSKAQMFTLGLQVIYAAEVLLHLVQRGVKIHIQPSILRRKLARFAAAAHASEVNAIWLREIDRVVSTAIVQRLRVCKAVVEEVHSRLGCR